MNHDDLNQLREAVTRRELSRAERERLHQLKTNGAVDLPAWAQEEDLTRLLNRLPDAPLASNFTARVLEAIDRDPVPVSWGLRLRSWAARQRFGLELATSATCMLLLFAGYSHYQTVRRQHMVASVASVVRSVEAASAVAQLPPVEILRDYDAIQGLSRSRPAADEELLVALDMN